MFVVPEADVVIAIVTANLTGQNAAIELLFGILRNLENLEEPATFCWPLPYLNQERERELALEFLGQIVEEANAELPM